MGLVGLFPEAKALTFRGNNVLAIPHDFHSTLYLRSQGIDVPAPVLSQYDWPGERVPYAVQKKTVAMMTTARRAYNLNGLGTGKTICTLWAFDYLKRMGLANKMIVVATISTLEKVWVSEVFRNFPHLTTAVLYGTKKKRLQRLAEDADIYIVNHDGVGTILDELMARKDIDVLAIDELAVYRNGRADRTKFMRKLAAGMRWVWGLTGGPMPKEVTDIWGQATIITPYTVPKYFNHLRQQLCYRVGVHGWERKADAIPRAFAMLQPSVRYTLDDIVELPETVMQYVDAPMGPKQKVVYDLMRKTMLAKIDQEEVTAMNAGAAMSKLLQIALGWVYTRDGTVVTLDNEDRIQLIVDSILNAQRKVIVFVPFKSALAGLSAAFTNEGIDHFVVSGSTPMTQRRDYFEAFQETSQYTVALAHPACMAHGLTLTAADTIIWGGPVTSLETFMQANGRITRLGQKHKQLVQMIGGTPVEKKLYKALEKKDATQKMFLDMIADNS
jgi:SNF2 family DNA or RNA helicase